MMKWNLATRMAAKGWTNAHHLATGAGLSYPVADRILHGDSPDRIDGKTLEKLRVAFGIRGAPWSLIEYIPEKPKR